MKLNLLRSAILFATLAFVARLAFFLSTHREIVSRVAEKVLDEKFISSAELLLEEIESFI
jgi:hypothetical protein